MSHTATPMAQTSKTAARSAAAAQPEPATVKVIKHNEATANDNVPTVVAVQNFRPAVNLTSQLMTALQYNHERIMRDLADRAPEIVLPTEGTLTSGFGARWGTMHNGIDIANVTNTPILSVMDGTVIDAGPAQGFGQWVRVQHDNGLVTVYGHIESIYVSVGERVVAGQTIAGMGNRGFSTGTHLHFEVHPDGLGPIDPLVWLAEHGLHLF
ncbi:M23 family metallopeptidase [Corynebacterium sp. TAE3-ERU12]|uniref:M23 family metallopeptidase n=1 Tax=Corynebacterium sp. TAE3-ERU12 TaxID=2849491 RepID=UPI001C47DD7D|nr:M23 family metallopeptidase [Corynebacterium sp. TAE3-ERU12]MBV7294779.1 M23 family metallopeptidase [Corynebacterium sp. TAE3-ERU12]